ncbi:MAG: hypothetical protein ACRCX2_10670 [Paraclostridium sp.]
MVDIRSKNFSWSCYDENNRFHRAFQQRVLDNEDDMILLLGARRVGKTEITLVKARKYAMDNPGSVIVYISSNYRGKDIRYENGSRIKFFLSNRKYEDNLRGFNVNFIIVEDFEEYSYDDFERAYKLALGITYMGVPVPFKTMFVGTPEFDSLRIKKIKNNFRNKTVYEISSEIFPGFEHTTDVLKRVYTDKNKYNAHVLCKY